MSSSLKVYIKDKSDLFILEYKLKKFIEENQILYGRLILITKELATNIIKYGGYGYIQVKIDVGKIEVVAHDFGRKKDEVNDFKKGLGLGLKIIKSYSHFFEFTKNEDGGMTARSIININGQSDGFKDFCPVDIGIATKPHHLEKHNGDIALFKKTSKGCLVLVADVLGHGIKAYNVAKKIEDVFLNKEGKNDLKTLFYAINDEISNTRGSALFLAMIDNSKIEYINIGNIRSWLVFESYYKRLAEIPGIVGRTQMGVEFYTEELFNKDVIVVICTDGISNSFVPKDIFKKARSVIAEKLAEEIILKHRIVEDDSTIVVIKKGGIV